MHLELLFDEIELLIKGLLESYFYNIFEVEINKIQFTIESIEEKNDETLEVVFSFDRIPTKKYTTTFSKEELDAFITN